MNVREAAVMILQRVEDGSYLNLTLNSCLNEYFFSREDADFLTRLVYSVKSHEITLMYGMQPVISNKKIRNFEKWVLMIAYCQMVYFDKVPDYAIINESVAMVKKKRGHKVAGFINVLLRQLTNYKEITIDENDPFLQMSIAYSQPLWLVKMLSKQYGSSTAKEIFSAFQEIPPLAARVNTLKTTREAILNDYPNLKAGKLCQDAVLFLSGNIAHHPLFKNGLVSVQDEASQMVARFLDVQDGMKVLDMCAAPGSKTCHLASLMHNTGEIHAYDLHEHKIELIKSNAKRLGCTNIIARAYDATHLLEIEEPESFDAVLLDGPCSGLGVLARKPEIRYRDSSAMDDLIRIQYELLKTSEKMLKKGGIMVYSTCTLNKKENEKNIERFLESHPWMALEEQRTILPMEYHSDGFYMAKLVKNDEEKYL